MGGFNLDLSGLNPAINALFQRQMAGIDYQLGRMPAEAAKSDYAYSNFLKNDRQKRDIAKQSFKSDQAAASLQRRLAEEAVREARGAKYEEQMKERAALQASLGANANMQQKYGYGGFQPQATIRDFYTYGPYSKGGRGGGSDSGGRGGGGGGESDADAFSRRSAEWQAGLWKPGLTRL